MKKSTEKFLLYALIAIIGASALISVVVFACGMAALGSIFIAMLPFMSMTSSGAYPSALPMHSASYWAAAQPLGITHANLSTDGTLTYTIQNNGFEDITLRKVDMRYFGSASGNIIEFNSYPHLSPHQIFEHSMSGLGSCNSGELKQIMVRFTYDKPNFTKLSQFGATNLAVVCGG
jgi:hypothetical protein